MSDFASAFETNLAPVAKLVLVATLFMVPLSEVFGHYYIPGPVNISIPNVINLVLFGAVIIDVAIKKKIPIRILPVIVIGCILMTHIIFLAAIGINNRHSNVIISMTGGLITLIGICYFYEVDKHAKLLNWSFFITAAVLVVSSILTILGFLKLPVDFVQDNIKYSFSRAESFGFIFPRSTGISGLNMGAYGSYVEVGVFVCLAWGLKRSGFRNQALWRRALAIFAAVVLAGAGIAVTQSRSYVLALAVGLVVFICLTWYLRSRSGKLRLVSLITVMGVLSLIGVVYVWEAFIGINPESVAIRLDIYQKALRMVAGSPILGNGFYAVAERYSSHLVHNNYLAYLVALGVVSFTLYMSLFVVSFYNGLKYLRGKGMCSREIIGLLSGFAAVCTELWLYAGITSPVNFILLGLFLSMGYPRLYRTAGPGTELHLAKS